MSEFKRINYKSDFDFILDVKLPDDLNIEQQPLIEYNVEGTLYTRGPSTYTFSKKGTVYNNCYNDKGKLHIIVSNHSLPAGVLEVELKISIPDNRYPTQLKNIVVKIPLETELVNGYSSEIESHEVIILAPYVKGDKGPKGDPLKWETMSERSKQELINAVIQAINGN